MSVMKQVRQILNLPQNELASIAGVSQATVCRWEKGQWEPNRDELERIRNYALTHGYEWEDAFFFPPDVTPTPKN
jgi:transcriptional regulator with XRE-family HTH domain